MGLLDSISGGIKNIGGSLSKGGFSIGGTFNSLNQKDKIAGNPNSELKELYESTNDVTLQYPMDLDDKHYLLFNITKRITTEDDYNEPMTMSKTFQTIVLPIPLNLTDTRSVQWNTTNLGIMGGLGAGQVDLGQANKDISGAVRMLGSAAYNNIKGNVSALVDSVKDQSLAESAITAAGVGVGVAAAGKLGLGGLTGGAAAFKYGQGLLFAGGKAYNPRMAALFDNVNFRDFTFSYRLIARNAEESDQITQIVRAFQKYMMPSYFGVGKSGFNYPMEFQLEFSDALKSHLFTFLPSVLKSVSVSYNGDTGPAFFASTEAPLIVDIQLNFQETKILTREAVEGEEPPAGYVEEKNDNTSGTTPGGTDIGPVGGA